MSGNPALVMARATCTASLGLRTLSTGITGATSSSDLGSFMVLTVEAN